MMALCGSAWSGRKKESLHRMKGKTGQHGSSQATVRDKDRSSEGVSLRNGQRAAVQGVSA